MEYYGNDFGVKPTHIIMGDVQFNQDFQKAQMSGIAYMMQGYPPVVRAAGMVLMFPNAQTAKTAFDHFLGWVEGSDGNGDAVQFDFIEKENGDYTLAISPNMECIIQRTIPEHLRDRINPIVMAPTYFKRMQGMGQNYQMFKRTHHGRTIPIHFGIESPTKEIRPSKEVFEKKVFGFYPLGDTSNPVVNSYRENNREGKLRDHSYRPQAFQTKDEIVAHRERVIKEVFPITYRKLTKQHWLKDQLNDIREQYGEIYIIQAICNLVARSRIDPGFNMSKDDFDKAMKDMLLNDVETFSSGYPEEPFFTNERVSAQLKADQDFLSQEKTK